MSIFIDSPHLDSAALRERLQFSFGTCVASISDAPGDYDEGARITNGSWFNSLPICETLIRIGDRGPAESTLAIVKVSNHIQDRLRDSRTMLSEPTLCENGKAAMNSVVNLLLAQLPEETGWRQAGAVLGVGFSSEPRPRLHTTTDSRTGKRIGLHLDNWEQYPYRLRWRAANRICLNLGSVERALFVVPESASTLVDRLQSVGCDVDGDPAAVTDSFGKRDLARKFLETFEETPLIRLEIHPGEAYIAPTENLIHDGSAQKTGPPDVCLTIRAAFSPL